MQGWKSPEGRYSTESQGCGSDETSGNRDRRSLARVASPESEQPVHNFSPAIRVSQLRYFFYDPDIHRALRVNETLDSPSSAFEYSLHLLL